MVKLSESSGTYSLFCLDFHFLNTGNLMHYYTRLVCLGRGRVKAEEEKGKRFFFR